MPSIISSLSNALVQTFDTVGDVAGAAQKTVGMATTYVDNRAKKQTKVDRESVMLSTAKDLLVLKKDLDADEELKTIFDALDKEW